MRCSRRTSPPLPMCHRAKHEDRTIRLGAGGVHRCRNPSSGHGMVSACQRRCSSTPGAEDEGLGERCAPAQRCHCSTARVSSDCPMVPPAWGFLPRSCKKKWELHSNSNHAAESRCSACRLAAEALSACGGVCTVSLTCTAAVAMPP